MSNTEPNFRALLESIKASRPFDAAVLSFELKNLATRMKITESESREAYQKAINAANSALERHYEYLNAVRAFEDSRRVFEQNIHVIESIEAQTATAIHADAVSALASALESAKVAYQLDASIYESIRQQANEVGEILKSLSSPMQAARSLDTEDDVESLARSARGAA